MGFGPIDRFREFAYKCAEECRIAGKILNSEQLSDEEKRKVILELKEKIQRF